MAELLTDADVGLGSDAAPQFLSDADVGLDDNVSKLGRALARSWENPGASVPGQVSVSVPGTGINIKPSLVGMAKTIWEGLKAPGQAVRGDFNVAPEGLDPNSEEAAYYRALAAENEASAGNKLAGTIMTGAIPGGIFGAPRGSLGMGAAQPGVASAPVAAAERVTPQQVVEAASRLDVPVPRYMVDESRTTQGLAAGLQNIPGAGDKIAKAADVTQRSLGTAAERVAEGFGTGSPAVAGSYAKDALIDWMTTGSQKVASRVYDAVDNLVDASVTTPLTATAQAVDTILARRAASKIPGESAAVKTVSDALATPGGLNYEGIKGLRTFLGEMTPEELVSQGLRGAEVKQIYGALTTDLRAAALNAGGEKAVTAFDKANRIYQGISERRAALSKVVGAKADASPEAVFSRLVAMAGSKSSADIGRLMQARKAMGPESWNEVASAVVNKLGRDPQGEFSIKRFLTAYGNLSNEGRSALFQTTGRDNLAQSLADINFVTKQIEEKLLQFYNPSGTAKSLASTGTVLGILHSPIKTLSTIVGGNRMATVLSEPATARAAADWAKSYREAIIAPSAKSSAQAKRAARQLATLITQRTGGNPETLATQLTGQTITPPSGDPALLRALRAQRGK